MQGYLLIFGNLLDFISFYVKLSGQWFTQIIQSEFAKWLTNSWVGSVFGRMLLLAAVGSLVAALFYRKQRMKRRQSAEHQAILSRQKRWSSRLAAKRELEGASSEDSTELTALQSVATSSTGNLLGWSIRRQLSYVRVDSCETMDSAELKIKSKAIGLGANALINLKFSVVNGKYAAEADAVVATALDEPVVDREVPTTATYTGSKTVRPTHP